MSIRFLIAVLGLLSLATPAPAQDVKSAESFLRTLYAGYAPGKKPAEVFGKDADRLFIPPLAGLAKAYAALEVDGVGAIDFDPICSCQDWDKLTVKKMDVTSDGPKQARATVQFDAAGSSVTVRYRLELVDGKWRIADISEDGLDGMRNVLATEIASMAKDLAK